MQALAAHLKRRNKKILEQELSLPKIPEVAPNQFTKTSVMMKKSRPVIKYVSETTFSPQQEHIHDQIKLVLHKQQPTTLQANSTLMEMFKVKQFSREKVSLPKIKECDTPENKKEATVIKHSKPYSTPRKSKSVNTKISLDSIFKDRNEFIESYFAQINNKLRR